MLTNFDIPFDFSIDVNCTLLNKVVIKNLPLFFKLYIPQYMFKFPDLTAKPKITKVESGANTVIKSAKDCKPSITAKQISEKSYFTVKISNTTKISEMIVLDDKNQEYIPKGTVFKINFRNGLFTKPNVDVSDSLLIPLVGINDSGNLIINKDDDWLDESDEEENTQVSNEFSDDYYYEDDYAEDSSSGITQENNGILILEDDWMDESSNTYEVDVDAILNGSTTTYEDEIDTDEPFDTSYKQSVPSLLFPVSNTYVEDYVEPDPEVEPEYETPTVEELDTDKIKEEDLLLHEDWLDFDPETTPQDYPVIEPID